ncbi:hypothetical protein [Flexibacterium corallicola]|uniref:hypothetical protein n=1 Tax=Flexibacterium corallicola TaxID=3037259 RepID=UPI00286F56EC|nr:hypothetical protein [Pseudovibrio sp. M1P-2-3]
MRRAAKVDANQSEIVQALRSVGATVTSLAAVGGGVPDLLVGYRRVNHLLEVKRETIQPVEKLLTPDQEEFHKFWRGWLEIVTNADQAIELITRRAA